MRQHCEHAAVACCRPAERNGGADGDRRQPEPAVFESHSSIVLTFASRLIVGEGLMIAFAGLGAGLIGADGFVRVLSTIVYGVSVHDAATFAGVPVVLMIVTLAACAIPARRASRVDPLVALRHD